MLPVIDIAKLRDPQFSQAEIAKLGYAYGEWGFSQLINHGVHEELLEKVEADVTAFFNLPLEQKKTVAIIGNSPEVALNAIHVQIRKDRKWFSVETRPGVLVVNIGDTLEIPSNWKYRSVEHWAVVNLTKGRISIATFHSSSYQRAIMGPLPEVVRGGKENYKSTPYEEFIKVSLSKKLDGRSYLESLKIN